MRYRCTIRRGRRAAAAGLLLATAAAAGLAHSAPDTLAIRVDELHVGTGEVIEDAIILIAGGRFRAVGHATGPDPIAIPKGARVLRAVIATPGFIDAHTSAGLSGLRNVTAVLDQDEPTNPDQAALRAIDAFDPRDPLLRFLLEHGVTVI